MAKVIEGVGLIAGMAVATFFDPALAPFMSTIAPYVLAAGGSMILQGIADELANNSTSNSISVKEPAGSRQVVYGSTRVSGTIVYIATTGNTQDWNQVVAWASHPVQSIDNLYLDGRKAYWADPVNNGPYPPQNGQYPGQLDSFNHTDDAGNTYNFNGKAVASHFNGSTAGYWFRDLYNATQYYGQGGAVWDNTCTLNGLAATYCRAKYDSGIFSSPPALAADMHGKCDIYDPRTGTRGWTNNATLIIADYLCNLDFGLGCDYATEIDEDQLIAVANICDEQVQLAVQAGSWQPNHEYAIGAVIRDSNGCLQTVQGFTTLSIPPKSGGSQPKWATSLGATTQDGQIIWVAGFDGQFYANQPLTEPRYTINGSFKYNANRGDVLANMFQACEDA